MVGVVIAQDIVCELFAPFPRVFVGAVNGDWRFCCCLALLAPLFLSPEFAAFCSRCSCQPPLPGIFLIERAESVLRLPGDCLDVRQVCVCCALGSCPVNRTCWPNGRVRDRFDSHATGGTLNPNVP